MPKDPQFGLSLYGRGSVRCVKNAKPSEPRPEAPRYANSCKLVLSATQQPFDPAHAACQHQYHGMVRCGPFGTRPSVRPKAAPPAEGSPRSSRAEPGSDQWQPRRFAACARASPAPKATPNPASATERDDCASRSCSILSASQPCGSSSNTAVSSCKVWSVRQLSTRHHITRVERVLARVVVNSLLERRNERGDIRRRSAS